MNIFVLDKNPERAARFHCDKHVVKMVLETAQLLSTVRWLADEQSAATMHNMGLIYRASHQNHPCTKWAAASRGNYHWLVSLGIALSAEFTLRYGKTHKSSAVIEALADCPSQVQRVRRTQFVLVVPQQHHRPDAVAAYRDYYVYDKAHFCRWTSRSVPMWFARHHSTKVEAAGVEVMI